MIVGTTILVIIFAEQLFCLDRYDWNECKSALLKEWTPKFSKGDAQFWQMVNISVVLITSSNQECCISTGTSVCHYRI